MGHTSKVSVNSAAQQIAELASFALESAVSQKVNTGQWPTLDQMPNAMNNRAMDRAMPRIMQKMLQSARPVAGSLWRTGRGVQEVVDKKMDALEKEDREIFFKTQAEQTIDQAKNDQIIYGVMSDIGR